MAGLLGMNAAAGEAQAHRYNAAIKERNAKSLELEADWTDIVGGIQIQDFLDDADDFNAGVDMAIRNNGWTLTGTGLDVYMENISQQEQETARMRMNIISEQRNISEQAANARMGADLDRMYAKNAITAGKYRAGQTLMGWGFKAALLV